MAHIVTKQKMMEELTRRTGRELHNYVGRALVVLLRNQTQDEQRDNQTKEHNDIGFTGADGRAGALSAKTYLKHGHFPHDWQLEQWLKPNRNGVPRIAKYWRQLDRAAKAKWAAEQRKREGEAPRQIAIPMHDEAAYKAARKAEEDRSEERNHTRACTAEEYRAQSMSSGMSRRQAIAGGHVAYTGD